MDWGGGQKRWGSVIVGRGRRGEGEGEGVQKGGMEKMGEGCVEGGEKGVERVEQCNQKYPSPGTNPKNS